MLFNSMQFLIFFPCVCLVYYVIPYRVRYLFLLACSYYFYMCWNPKYALLMLTSTVITYLSGLLIDSADKSANDEKHKKRLKQLYLTLSFVSNLAILFFFKYYDFAANTIVSLFSLLHIQITVPRFDIVLPVGISFYTFQALSYSMDVYRKDIYAEKNFFKYALFVSFFPQLVAGPIERSKNLLIQINKKHPFDYEEVRKGLILMMYGFFQKVVLANYIARIVDAVYDNYTDCTGFQLLTASVLFAFQIYCDFASYSNIAIGAARVMGFKLMDNFDTPYFSRSVAEFWRRWHISLSSWFKDYLYIPLGGSRKGQTRKNINRMIVFLVSGLWHGANWHFVFWGGLNGLFQVIGDYLKPYRKKFMKYFHIDENSSSHKLMQMIITFILVDFTWIFFRAGLLQSFAIIKTILGLNGGSWMTFGNNLTAMNIDQPTVTLLIVSFGLLLLADICRYNHINLIDWICGQGLWLRWLLLYCLIFFILIFGAYGPGFDSAGFIYFQF